MSDSGGQWSSQGFVNNADPGLMPSCPPAPVAGSSNLVSGASQIITEYKDGELDLVLGALERMTQHLTAAVVSNDISFQQKARRAVCSHAVLGMRVDAATVCNSAASAQHVMTPACLEASPPA